MISSKTPFVSFFLAFVVLSFFLFSIWYFSFVSFFGYGFETVSFRHIFIMKF